MPDPKHLRKTTEVWTFTAPPPSGKTITIEVQYGITHNDILFAIYLDDPYEHPSLTESEARAVTDALDELHTRLGIPKGETKC